ncbi:hypothetical protein Aple_032920 [Acrocarpospora pleiomorpha]|uniref:Glycosyl transferase n=1 Tax=Acrocarpospora pleiomorpha TaxID=90975 RepID=A0A5M3XI54_9ACTN|nr:hypothetical protein [Acrocarpospora pleiomorpha]GES20396.1 hypothetical protein Aple_032920 [Acrocarpospora pleiomorpha]
MTIYVEVPNLGFGPAVTALRALARIPAEDVHVLATGDSARFLQRERPAYTWHDADTLWPQGCAGLLPPGSLVVSVTNPEFAAWAVEQGHEVGVVDVLDWMWPLARPAALPDPARLRFHLVEAGFARPRHGEPVAPLIDHELWSEPAQPRSGLAVVAFGGMAMPGGADHVGAFARSFLFTALPVLVEAGLAHVVVVGGSRDLVDLVPPRWRAHPAVEVRAAVPPAEYAALLRSARHVLIPAGMSTLHECAAARITPFVQPGCTISTVLATERLSARSYPYVCRWPGQSAALAPVLGRPEPELIERAAELVAAGAPHLADELRRYLVRVEGPALLPMSWDGLPTAADRLAHHVLTRRP